MELSDRPGKKTLPTQDFSRPGPGCSRLGLDNPGLEWEKIQSNSLCPKYDYWMLQKEKRKLFQKGI